jgi:hypothetical protein
MRRKLKIYLSIESEVYGLWDRDQPGYAGIVAKVAKISGFR